MKIIIAIIIELLFFSCAIKNEKSEKNIGIKVMIPSGKIIHAKKVIDSNITFIYGIDEKDNVIYVSTNDSKFKIQNYNLNNTFGDISLNMKDMKYIPGWGYYIKIDNIWYAGFNFKSKPRQTSKIEWFFKYNFPKENKNLFEK